MFRLALRRILASFAALVCALIPFSGFAQDAAGTRGTLVAVAPDGRGGAIAVGWLRDPVCLHPLAETGDVSTWRVQPLPAPHACATLQAVVSDGRGGAWAVGDMHGRDGLRHTLTERYDGRAWSIVPSPSPGRQSMLGGVTMTPSGQVFAVGAYEERGAAATGATKTLALAYAGSRWRIVPSPTPGVSAALTAVTAEPNGRLWAVGYFSERAPAPQRTLVLTYESSSGWRPVATPSPPTNTVAGTVLNAVASGGGSVWAVGRYVDPDNRVRTLTLRSDGRGWSIVPTPAVPSSDTALENIVVAADGTAWTAGWYQDDACLHALTMRFVLSAWEPTASQTPVCTQTRGTALHAVTIGAGGIVFAVGEVNGANTFVEVNRGSGWQVLPS